MQLICATTSGENDRWRHIKVKENFTTIEALRTNTITQSK